MAKFEVEAFMDAHNDATGESFEVAWASTGDSEPTPATAKPFLLETLDGSTYDFGATLGTRPAVIAFWASWCAPCIAEAPHLQALHSEFGEQIDIVGVSVDTPAHHGKLRAIVKRMGLGYPIPLDTDGSVYATFNPRGTIPYTVVVDRAGTVTYVSTNFEAGDEADLRAAAIAVAGASDQRE